ncbi:MAG: creatininase family protein [Variovorax sp.]
MTLLHHSFARLQRWATHTLMSLAAVLLCFIALPARLAHAAPLPGIYLDEMTWTELRDRIAAGTTTVLMPIGGTEQSGPHMALGKHNVRAHWLAGKIAEQLGNAVVAPVLAYVPEGSINPPAAHMRFTGTISISEQTFEALLESAARSFRQHGFRTVVFLGDHGGYQKNEEHVAAKLNREWKAPNDCQVIALVDYYRAAQGGYEEALRGKGLSAQEIGTHAGVADTSLTLAIAPELVRRELLAQAAAAGAGQGVYGDPRRSSAALGQLGVERIVAQSVARVRSLAKAH